MQQIRKSQASRKQPKIPNQNTRNTQNPGKYLPKPNTHAKPITNRYNLPQHSKFESTSKCQNYPENTPKAPEIIRKPKTP